ncbi:hypothetical protein ACP275_07G113500 [Erythranthe tilingii]
MGRSPCCSKVGLNRGPWSAEEDTLLTTYIQQHGEGQWKFIPNKACLLRCGKSCLLRWMNYLRPGLKRGNISDDEEDLIVRLHMILGNRWSLIAGRLPGRTDNEIKNHWNTYLLKKLKNDKDLPESPKTKKSTATAAKGKKKKKPKRKTKKKKKVVNVDEEKIGNKEKLIELSAESKDRQIDKSNNPPKSKVYMPKPTRVSPRFSYMAPVAVAVEELPQLFGVFGGGGEEDDHFDLGGGYILPVFRHSDSLIPSEVDMLEKVYNEYLQLL